MITKEKFYEYKATARWTKDLIRFTPIKSQFILSGNIRDSFPFPTESDRCQTSPLLHYLVQVLSLYDYDYFISFNIIEGFQVLAAQGEGLANAQKFFSDSFRITFDEQGHYKCSIDKSIDIIEKIIAHRDNFIAVFMDFASRYVKRSDALSPEEHEYFTKALMLSYSSKAHTTNIKGKDHVNTVFTNIRGKSQFNTVFWFCDRENDLPDWFSHNNPRVRSITIPKPDHIVRRAVIQLYSSSPPLKNEKETISDDQIKKYDDIFVEQTEGMVISDIVSIVQLCLRDDLHIQKIAEGVRRYKLGVTEDPWRRIDKEKIKGAVETISENVKGQQQSITKALDIIKRAMTGLSGAQASKIGGKPRGILFFAGPTGVGKTELAKSITNLLFNDERAYIRFDMSEFSAEHADQRLIGAPPGYVGYDAGGELTNAIKEKPFSVVLFDEIEKAHPRILDKFLQVLDDGVLTSGRGERVYFSEAVIIFTSNLGFYKIDNTTGVRVQNISDQESYEVIEKKIRNEINFYFKNQLNRPEMLNRIGENIVVFDFIRKDVAMQIFKKMLNNIRERLYEQKRIELDMPPEIASKLEEHCLNDLTNGGRGIGNQLEAWFINPLARALFDNDVKEDSKVRITSLEIKDEIPTLGLSL